MFQKQKALKVMENPFKYITAISIIALCFSCKNDSNIQLSIEVSSINSDSLHIYLYKEFSESTMESKRVSGYMQISTWESENGNTKFIYEDNQSFNYYANFLKEEYFPLNINMIFVKVFSKTYENNVVNKFYLVDIAGRKVYGVKPDKTFERISDYNIEKQILDKTLIITGVSE